MPMPRSSGATVQPGPATIAPRTATVPASGAPAPPVALAVDPLETTWVRWNADQDVAGGYGGAPPKP